MSRFMSGAITAAQGSSAFEQSLYLQVRQRVQAPLLSRVDRTQDGTSAGRIAAWPWLVRKGRLEPLHSALDRNRGYDRKPAASAMPPHRDRDVLEYPQPQFIKGMSEQTDRPRR